MLTPKNDEDSGFILSILVAITDMLLPLISSLADMKNEEVDFAAKIKETC